MIGPEQQDHLLLPAASYPEYDDSHPPPMMIRDWRKTAVILHYCCHSLLPVRMLPLGLHTAAAGELSAYSSRTDAVGGGGISSPKGCYQPFPKRHWSASSCCCCCCKDKPPPHNTMGPACLLLYWDMDLCCC